MLAGSEMVRSWFEPDSVMEFGCNASVAGVAGRLLGVVVASFTAQLALLAGTCWHGSD